MFSQIASSISNILNKTVLRWRGREERMSWDYRIVRKATAFNGKKYYSYGIHEIYYDNRNRVVAVTEDPVQPTGETVMELIKDVYLMLVGMGKPILDWDLIPKDGLEPPTMSELKNTPVVLHPWVPPSREEIEKIEKEIEQDRVLSENVHKLECCQKSPQEVLDFMILTHKRWLK